MATTTNTDESTAERKWLGSRIFSISALCATICGVGYLGKTAYHVATDAFVVPVVLSPDSDLVIQSKLSRGALMAERLRAVTKKEQIDAELDAADQAVAQLKALHASASKALEWTSALTSTQATAGVTDLRALQRQNDEITAMVEAQTLLLERLKKELDSGLVSKADYAREQQALGQMRVAAIDNERARLSTNLQMSQVALTQQALRGQGAARVSTPEMLLQQDQLVRIQCDLLKLEAERRAKSSERQHIGEELTKLDELLGQLNQRPIFRAIDASTNIAFIPYSQLDGVTDGGKVYECVWGVFACKPVGKVTEVLAGEAIVPDPWGSLARGQYAVIQLDDQHAAQSKTLRVRMSGANATAAKASDSTTRVAHK